MKRLIKTFVLVLLTAVVTSKAQATLINDTVSASYSSTFSNIFNTTAIVGDGVEFSGNDLFLYSYTLDFTANSFTLTVSKGISQGNFTAIFDNLFITGIDATILNVTFDHAASSSFSDNKEPTIDLSTPGTIHLFSSPFALSANTPASALSHSFTWNIAFESTPVPNPNTLYLFVLVVLITCVSRTKIAKT